MNVASLENCKRLYEVSGWSKTDKYWFYEDSFNLTHPEWNSWELASHDMDGKAKPAYDLGYLLRMLPTHVRDGYYLTMEHDADEFGWIFGYAEYGDITQEHGIANNPEDAACLLAIKLFEKGVLTRES